MLKDLAVKTKILLLAGIMLLIVAVVAVVGVFSNRAAKQALDDMYHENIMSSQFLNDANNRLRTIDVDASYLMQQDYPQESRQLLLNDILDRIKGIRSDAEELKKINRSDKVQHIEPAPVLIVEGILPFVEPELCALFDYKIYVDTDADERILRRILRDVKERGRSLDSVITQYRTTVKPMHEAFVEPSKRNADIIVPNGGENTAAVEMLAHHIRNLIEKANMM